MPGRPARPLSPASPPSPARVTPDRTSLIVRVGLLLLFILGVGSVFGETLMGLLYPPTGTSGPGLPPSTSEK
jgi:hypothetical protein